jgi:glyoxylase-like metal-dependent hydrolase (beta-lactamase superfamily II)
VNIAVFVVGPFQENAYLLTDTHSGDAVFIDPGDSGDALAEVVRAREVNLAGIWLTHAHVDHIGGIAGIKRQFDVPIFMHPSDMLFYKGGADVVYMFQITLY